MVLFSLKGKIAVVTGGSNGIGYEIAQLYAQQGAKVFNFDINQSEKAVDNQVTFVHCDVGDEQSVAAAFRTVGDIVDILVNNAGIAAVGNLLQCSVEEMDRIYRVNIKGAMLVAKQAVSRMVDHDKGGSIINMASCASLHPIRDRFAYVSSKGAVLTITQSIATDFVDKGIRCNCICPGRIHTPLVDGFVKKNYPGRETEMMRRLAEYMPMGRMGHPREIAFFALYLASDEAKFVSGGAFPVDGGIVGIDHPKVYDHDVTPPHPSLLAKM